MKQPAVLCKDPFCTDTCSLAHKACYTNGHAMILCLQVQKALVDVENMFDLLATDPIGRDSPGAQPLSVVSGMRESECCELQLTSSVSWAWGTCCCCELQLTSSG